MAANLEQWVKRYEPLIIAAFFVAGAYFLFRMAYLPGYVSLPVSAVLLLAFRQYIQLRYGAPVPFFLLFLCWVSVGLDWLGNIFNWYRDGIAGYPYDQITHTLVPLLVVPCFVWLLNEAIRRFGYALPLGAVTLFAVTTLFTVAGFYEVLELWDDKYMHPDPGWRIHGAYDTANDLQCDLLGMVIGGVIAYWWLKRTAAKS